MTILETSSIQEATLGDAVDANIQVLNGSNWYQSNRQKWGIHVDKQKEFKINLRSDAWRKRKRSLCREIRSAEVALFVMQRVHTIMREKASHPLSSDVNANVGTKPREL